MPIANFQQSPIKLCLGLAGTLKHKLPLVLYCMPRPHRLYLLYTEVSDKRLFRRSVCPPMMVLLQSNAASKSDHQVQTLYLVERPLLKNCNSTLYSSDGKNVLNARIPYELFFCQNIWKTGEV